jgi:hypothetical protein
MELMDQFLFWLESTALSVWLRESISVFAFPMILAYHTIGMGFVAGLSSAVDLRILGVARRVPLLELKRFLPATWVAFWLNAVSGVLLLIAYPTKALTNPVFYVKLICIGLAVAILRSIANSIFQDPNLDLGEIPARGKWLAGASLFCWGGAILAGRLLAYTYTRLTQ